MMRILVLCLVSLPSLAAASTPNADTIEYSSPEKYLALSAILGDREKIQNHANAVQGRNEKETVQNVLNWMESHLTYDPDAAYEWRNFDDVMQDRCYGGCADQSIVCGSLLKATGIPTVWVKTMDVLWIWDFKKGRPFDSWSGHVFLEIYLEKNGCCSILELN